MIYKPQFRDFCGLMRRGAGSVHGSRITYVNQGRRIAVLAR